MSTDELPRRSQSLWLVEARYERGIVITWVGRRQNLGEITLDLDAVLFGDHGEMEADECPQFAESQAEAVGLRPSVIPELASVRSGRIDKAAQRQTHRPQAGGKRPAGFGTGQFVRQELADLDRRVHAVHFVLGVTDAEEQPAVFEVGNNPSANRLVARYLLPVEAEAERPNACWSV